jgi:hypothetical protein
MLSLALRRDALYAGFNEAADCFGLGLTSLAHLFLPGLVLIVLERVLDSPERARNGLLSGKNKNDAHFRLRASLMSRFGFRPLPDGP